MAGSRIRSGNFSILRKAVSPTDVRRSAPKSRKALSEAEAAIKNDLPAKLSPTKAEIALWRAFLADEIEAILRDGE